MKWMMIITMSSLLVTLVLFTTLRYVLWGETNTGRKQFPEKEKILQKTLNNYVGHKHGY